MPENVPLLDSHSVANGCLGHLSQSWATDDSLFDELIFTGAHGRRVYELIERGSLTKRSLCGFDIVNIAIRDADGGKVYVEDAIERGPDDPDLIVIAQHTILREVSVTAMPADRNACVLSASMPRLGV